MIWYAGRVGKRIKGVFPDRPINLTTSVGPEQHTHRWKDSVDAPDELVTSIVNGFIHGADPWFTKFNARIVAVANIDNAMSMRGQVHRLRPLGRQAVSIEASAGVERVRATRVIAGGEHDVRIAGGRAVAVLDAVEHLEVVRFEWSTSGGAGGAAGHA